MHGATNCPGRAGNLVRCFPSMCWKSDSCPILRERCELAKSGWGRWFGLVVRKEIPVRLGQD